MAYLRYVNTKFLLLLPMLLVLVIAVACGEDATPIVIEKEVIVEKEVIKEVPVEVIKEVIVVATPTPAPEAMIEAKKVDRLVTALGPLQREVNVLWFENYISLDRRHLYERLIGVDRNTGEFIPELATKWEVNSEGTDWTFTLRKGVPFHFGWGEFTAEDVKHRMAMSVTEGSMATEAKTYKALIDSVEVVDPYTVIYHQTRADVLNVPNLESGKATGSTGGISKAQWDEEGLDGYQKTPTGTGSYQWVERVPGSYTLAQRVENHWRHTPDFKEIQILLTAEEATRMASLLAGETHIVSLSRDVQSQALDAGMKLVTSSQPSRQSELTLGGSYYSNPEVLDFDKSPWSDPKVGVLIREAMNRAIDREEIRDTLFLGQGDFLKVLAFHPGLEGYNTEWDTKFDDAYGYDPARAKELLAEAGYADGFPVKILLVHRDDMPEAKTLVEVIGQYWSTIGLDVTLEDLEYPTVQKQTKDRELSGTVRIHTTGFRPTQYNIRSFYTSNCGACAYEDEFTNKKYLELESAIDAKERDDLSREIGNYLFDKYPVIPLFWLKVALMVNPKVVADYTFPGNTLPAQSHLEFVKAAAK